MSRAAIGACTTSDGRRAQSGYIVAEPNAVGYVVSHFNHGAGKFMTQDHWRIVPELVV